MRDFKTKLISFPLNPHIVFAGFSLPYGLGILAAFLRSNNYNVVVDDLSIKIENHNRRLPFYLDAKIDLNIMQDDEKIINYAYGRFHDKQIDRFAEQLAEIIDYKGYDLIGLSVITYYHFLFALLLCKKIKSLSNAKVVLGGPFITICGKGLFDQFPVGDYVIVGDGQIPLLRLIEHLAGHRSIEGIPNLIYRQNGSIRENPREFFPINDLHTPDFSDLPLDFYRLKTERGRLYLPYQTSRGCTHNCSFCNRRKINPSFESKSYDKTIRELENMKKRYNNNDFWFCDEAINCSYKYLDGLCDIFIKENLDISWRASARADNLDRTVLHKMKKSGCRTLAFGIESGSNRVLKAMRKDFTSKQAIQVLRDSYCEGIKNFIFLIAGFPHEKDEDVSETVDFIKNNAEYIDTIVVQTPLYVEQGTALYNNPEEFGIENLRPVFDSSGRLEFKYFAFDEIGGLRWEEKIEQQEHSRKRVMKANFKYILSKKYHLGFMPFWAYFWIKEKLYFLYNCSFFPLLQRFLFYRLGKSTNR